MGEETRCQEREEKDWRKMELDISRSEYTFHTLTLTADIPFSINKMSLVIVHCFSYITSFKYPTVILLYKLFYYFSFIDEIMKINKVK